MGRAGLHCLIKWLNVVKIPPSFVRGLRADRLCQAAAHWLGCTFLISHFCPFWSIVTLRGRAGGWLGGEWRILVTLNHIHSNYCSSQLPSDGVKRRMINGNVEPLLCVRVSRWQSIVTPIHRNDQHTDWIVTADSLGKVNTRCGGNFSKGFTNKIHMKTLLSSFSIKLQKKKI